MRGGVVFREDPSAVVGGEDEDGVDGEEGHIRGHGCAGEGVRAHRGRGCRRLSGTRSWGGMGKQGRQCIGVVKLSLKLFDEALL